MHDRVEDNDLERLLELNVDTSIFEKAKDAIKALDELALVMEEIDSNEFTSMFFSSPVGHAKRQYEKTGYWPF